MVSKYSLPLRDLPYQLYFLSSGFSVSIIILDEPTFGFLGCCANNVNDTNIITNTISFFIIFNLEYKGNDTFGISKKNIKIFV